MNKYSNDDKVTVVGEEVVLSEKKLKDCCRKSMLKKGKSEEEAVCTKCGNNLFFTTETIL